MTGSLAALLCCPLETPQKASDSGCQAAHSAQVSGEQSVPPPSPACFAADEWPPVTRQWPNL